MKIVGICGSPRKEQTTEFALTTVLNAAEKTNENIKTELINLNDKKISPCIACGHCAKELRCSAHNDDFNSLIPILNNPEVSSIVIASPVYMGSMTAQTKAFIDRSVMFRRNGYLFKNHIGAAIAVGGSRNGGQELTIQAIHAALLIHEMIIVGDASPTAHFGGTGWQRVPGGIENDSEAINTFKNLGKKIAECVILTNK